MNASGSAIAPDKPQTAGIESMEISVKGQWVRVPTLELNGKILVVTGNWLKIAAVHDEDWSETELEDPELCVRKLKESSSPAMRADLFTFSQKLTDPTPRFPFLYEWDSVAAIRVVSFSDWWTNRVSSDLRCDVRKAAKRGVVVRPVTFTDDFVRGIVGIYDERPIRHGRKFWHYKKGFDAVKRENATYLERSDFLGAFLAEELIGFLKIVYVDHVARLMQIISKDAHRDKRPMNALIAKAVQVCEAKGCSHLTYGNYRYSQETDSLTAFKKRNGFEEILVPKYYVPLTTKGSLALRLQLQRGAKALVPNAVLLGLKRARSFIYLHSPLTRKAT
jgi:hypothetical protein